MSFVFVSEQLMQNSKSSGRIIALPVLACECVHANCLKRCLGHSENKKDVYALSVNDALGSGAVGLHKAIPAVSRARPKTPHNATVTQSNPPFNRSTWDSLDAKTSEFFSPKCFIRRFEVPTLRSENPSNQHPRLE